MASTVKFDIPHDLGRAEARRRIEIGLPKLESEWTAEDRLALDIVAMGQKVRADMTVGDRAITGTVTVPMMLAMMSGPIGDFVRTSAEKMLARP